MAMKGPRNGGSKGKERERGERKLIYVGVGGQDRRPVMEWEKKKRGIKE
jgi:hypothetical protein